MHDHTFSELANHQIRHPANIRWKVSLVNAGACGGLCLYVHGLTYHYIIKQHKPNQIQCLETTWSDTELHILWTVSLMIKDGDCTSSFKLLIFAVG